jgi:hypothetical protein
MLNKLAKNFPGKNDPECKNTKEISWNFFFLSEHKGNDKDNIFS